jgi:hypothetical protein
VTSLSAIWAYEAATSGFSRGVPHVLAGGWRACSSEYEGVYSPRPNVFGSPFDHPKSPPLAPMRSLHLKPAALKSAAFAMRHSAAQGARAGLYDKERSERLSAAAVQVATDFAAGFK